jgi:hypothetical protein
MVIVAWRFSLVYVPSAISERTGGRANSFLNRFGIEVVPLGLGQEKDGFMRLGAAISNALGHWIGLRPNNFLAQIPTVGLQSEGKPPGDANEVFRFELAVIPFCGLCGPPHFQVFPAVRQSAGVFCGSRFIAGWSGAITITDIYPANSIAAQHPTYFTNTATISPTYSSGDCSRPSCWSIRRAPHEQSRRDAVPLPMFEACLAETGVAKRPPRISGE